MRIIQLWPYFLQEEHPLEDKIDEHKIKRDNCGLKFWLVRPQNYIESPRREEQSESSP